MKNILIFITFSLLSIGCGGGSNSGSSAPDAPGIIPEKGDTEMTLNETYSISSGDQIVPETTQTRIKVTHVDGSSGSSVVLIEGSATIKK